MHNIMQEYYSWVTKIVHRSVGADRVSWCNNMVSQLCHTTLRCCLHQYHACKAVSCQVLVVTWDLVFAVTLMLYKLIVIFYRLTLGRFRSEMEESTVPDLIESHGYKVETHRIETEDGYLLELHRIPATRGSRNRKHVSGARGKSVLLMHGMMCSSYCWVTSDTNSLAFILSDQGYDVWLGNFRGTKYSRKHVSLDPDKDLQFWRFSLHELGVKDLSAMITNILRISGNKKLSFIGHSMGTTCFLILASYRPSLVTNVDLAILMAPVVEPHHMSNFIWYVAPLQKLAKVVMESLGILEILPASLLIEKLTWDHIGHLCLKLQLRGPVLNDRDQQMMSRICHHARTSKTSFFTILHYGQNITNKCFHAYDWYDARENLARYGTISPPLYTLSEVPVPVALFWSPKDTLSSKQDMQRLVTELPHVVDCKETNIGHLDYLWGSNVKGDIYYDVLDLLSSN